MKRLLTVIALLTLVLSGCTSVTNSVQENTPTATVLVESTQEIAPTETIPAEGVSKKPIEVIGGNEESMREFIKQWLIPVYPDGSSQDVTVYISSMPKDIPYDLPTPDDARIIGSITGNWVDYLLIFDSSLSSKSIHEFYARSLIEKGWHEAPTQGQAGFTSQSDLYSGYCYKDDTAFLSIETPALADKKNGIRLSLDITPDTHMCNTDTNYGAPYASLIPSLTAPKGMVVQGGGSGGSDNDAEVTATLKGNLSEIEIAGSYNEQLLAAGWTMQNSNNGGGAAWSNWTFKDKKETNFIGTLIVVKTSPDSETLFALLRIQKK